MIDIKGIIDDSEKVSYLKNGVNTVIAGKPNVGKSSLLNLLSGFERAIVTSVPGTTRDTVSETVSFGKVTLNITDTAGIHESSDEVETIGISKAKEEIKKADLILFLIDSSSEIDDEDRMIADMLHDKSCIVILNKTDQTVVTNEEDVKKLTGSPSLKMSVLENFGTDVLKKKIEEMFIKDEIRDSGIYVTNLRQLRLFRQAEEALNMVIESIDKGMSEDIYTVDLMNAYAYLGEITGEDIGDDLADKIFSEFCMGK